jgi:hypothetical protein
MLLSSALEAVIYLPHTYIIISALIVDF